MSSSSGKSFMELEDIVVVVENAGEGGRRK
jgi:hypothetical protein